jgi:hypothetical protein
MKINLGDLKYYFLTCNNPIRQSHMLNEFSDLDLTEINSIIGIGKHKSLSVGFSRMLDAAAQDQDYTKPFQPFMIFEDDATKFREFPKMIDIPDDTDILYVGISEWCMTDKQSNTNNLCIEFVHNYPEIVRIKNMLSGHGILVCSIRGMLSLQKCQMESYFKNIATDIFFAHIQPYLNVYALKRPLVYQYGRIGGQEKPTKITFDEEKNNPMNPNWKNITDVSILMFK